MALSRDQECARGRRLIGAFLDVIDERPVDVVYIDKSGLDDNWNYILQETKRHWYNALVVFIVADDNNENIVSMLENGAYDVLSSLSAGKMKSHLIRISRVISERSALDELTRDKLFGDYIAENSRSMLSIINRDYRYEKVNTKFCAAHNIEEGAIVGKSLSEVWGNDTFID